MISKESEILKDLRNLTTCELRFDPISRKCYSVDASIYEVEPLGVAIPKTKQDVIQAIQIAYRHKVPIIARGAATGITGGCLGTGLILDLSKYLNKICEINIEKEYVICEPGVVQDALNGSLSPHGYRLGPDTSTGNRATLGGMLANNAAGSRSLHYGCMVDHVIETEIVLATGEVLKFGPAASLPTQGLKGHIYAEILRLRDQYRNEIQARFPQIPRRVSGYNLDQLLKPGIPNIASLIVGSEGTLGIVTEMKLRISKKPRSLALAVLHFDNKVEAMFHIPNLLSFHPFSLEMIDDQILEIGRHTHQMKNKLEWLVNKPEAIFVAEFEGATPTDAHDKARFFANEMEKQKIGFAQVVLTNPEQMDNIWQVRKSGLGLLLSRRTYSRAIAFIEDLSIPPEKLAPFMAKFTKYLALQGKEAGIYGHVGSGCMHIRPYMDLRMEKEIELFQKMMLDVSDMILECGGAMSGEHGDGLIRSWLNQKMFGDKIYQAFLEVKKIFDPSNLMNPGKIVHGPPVNEHLRLDPHTKITPIKTFFDFHREGGFELAADLCNGNGLCRKKEGVMCPSFQVTQDEYDTTRARAQALRSIINGKLPPDTICQPELLKILDLCIECKGCKSECPSQVDMAKMKAEVLYQHHQKYGYSFRSWLFGHVGTLFKLGFSFGNFFNKVTHSKLGKHLLDWVGITDKRNLPSVAPIRFSHWFQKNYIPHEGRKQVVLFNDTYTEFIAPEIGIAAVKVLHALGYHPILPPWKCCGRPLISKGILKQAQNYGKALVETLYPYANSGIPIVGIEPSCILTLKDEFRDLHLGIKAQSISEASKTFDEFVAEHVVRGKLPLVLRVEPSEVLLHGHCYQKALVGTKATLKVLKAIPGFEVREIDSGCCGMAGSFGYEKEHYPFSLKIAELKLLPAVRSASSRTQIVADGISCRTQIEHGSSRHAVHLAQFLASLIL